MVDITLLDGSIGQELVKRSGDRATPLWSTRVMIDHPDLVGDVHSDYFPTAAQRLRPPIPMRSTGRDLCVWGLEDSVPKLIDTALSQAERARKGTGGRIAGSLGPLLASYRPDLNPDPDEAAGKIR